MRGIAVLLVMINHFFPGYLSLYIGWSGVDLFFVLSGFFVSGILFREYKKYNNIKKGRFLIRRAFKIWPLFYFALLIHIFYFNLKGHHFPTRSILAEIFFLQDYIKGITGITWSLGIEEQFYILLVFALAACFYFKKLRRIVTGCIAIMLLILAIRIIHYFYNPYYDPYTHHYPLHLRADALCCGIIISYQYHFYEQQLKDFINKYAVVILITALCFLAPVAIFPYNDYHMYTIGLTTTYLGYGLIVTLLLIRPLANERWQFFFNRAKLPIAMAWIGYYSYAIYLFHVLIGIGAANFFRKNIWSNGPLTVYFLVFILSNILFGWLASVLVEQPFLRLRNRLFPAE